VAFLAALSTVSFPFFSYMSCDPYESERYTFTSSEGVEETRIFCTNGWVEKGFLEVLRDQSESVKIRKLL